MLVVSTHAHGGAAGDGNDELAGVDSIAFDDLAASPDAAGELQRNGVNLEWYGAAVVAITEADAVAGTASPRTLGTGAQQAAAGDHTHNPTEVNITENETATGGLGHVTAIPWVATGIGTTETDLASQARTPSGAQHALIGVGTWHGTDDNGDNDDWKARLYLDAVEKVSQTKALASTFWGILSYTESNPSVASHTYKTTLQITTETGTANDHRMGHAGLSVVEVKVS